ncbi:MAG: hypothetical protein KBD64_03150 [Gammaproteobacteria bacterium]|nr:hypothetical protein [Gammaproteobacteria bacterium]
MFIKAMLKKVYTRSRKIRYIASELLTDFFIFSGRWLGLMKLGFTLLAVFLHPGTILKIAAIITSFPAVVLVSLILAVLHFAWQYYKKTSPIHEINQAIDLEQDCDKKLREYLTSASPEVSLRVAKNFKIGPKSKLNKLTWKDYVFHTINLTLSCVGYLSSMGGFFMFSFLATNTVMVLTGVLIIAWIGFCLWQISQNNLLKSALDYLKHLKHGIELSIDLDKSRDVSWPKPDAGSKLCVRAVYKAFAPLYKKFQIDKIAKSELVDPPVTLGPSPSVV